MAERETTQATAQSGQSDSGSAIETLLAHWRWQADAGQGGMAGNIRAREAALKDACRRAAAELDGAKTEDNQALLQLAASWRQRALDGWLPDALPPAPAGRAGQQMDEATLRREQQIGYALAFSACAAELHDLAGGEL